MAYSSGSGELPRTLPKPPPLVPIYGSAKVPVVAEQLTSPPSSAANYLTIFRPVATSGEKVGGGGQTTATAGAAGAAAAESADVQSRKYRKTYTQYEYGGFRTSQSRDIRKKEDRREKNRLAAKNCREEKQNYIRSLETRITMLEARNRQLISKLGGLKDIILELARNQACPINRDRVLDRLREHAAAEEKEEEAEEGDEEEEEDEELLVVDQDGPISYESESTSSSA